MKKLWFSCALRIIFFCTFCTCYLTRTGIAQTLVISNKSPKQKIVTATGTLEASTLNYAHFPMALGIDSLYAGNNFARKILLSWFINIDEASAEPAHKRMNSINDGVSWSTITGGLPDNNVNIGNATKLKSGRLIALPFKPTYVKPSGNLTYPFDYYSSVNNGDSWQKHTDGIVDFSPLQVNGIRFHKGIIEEPDGSLYAPAYVSYTPAASNPVRTYLLKSVDGGKTWKPMPNSTTPLPIAENTNESTIARCKDGSWLVVLRQSTSGAPLLYSRSTDNGLSWSQATKLPGLGDLAKSIDPKLMLMPNGVMVLSYGRPDLHLAFSMDGSGIFWSNDIKTYVDADETRPTSANSSLTYITHNKLIQFGDYYAATYNPNTQGIWQKEIGVRRSDLFNRLDLRTKFANNDITITTDLNYSNASHPEARVAAVFDGSTDYWSGAFKQATSGYYLIDLKQAQTLNTVGVCLAKGLPQSAIVKYSLDNISYTTLKTYTNTTHYTLDYTTAENFVARYIKVEIEGSGPLVGLNELQLFSVENTFDEDEINSLPYGYTAINGGFWVSSGVTPMPTGYKSNQALYMFDNDAQDKTIAKTGFTPSDTKTLEFYIRTKAFATTGGAIQWRVMSGSTIAYLLRVISGGTIQYYNGTAYQTITGITIPTDTWTHVKIVAKASIGNGTISINGGTPISISKLSTFTGTSFDGFSFASGGAAAIGDKALFDDVSFYSFPPGTVPVTLTSFSGKLKNNSVRLNWQTAFEQNNSYFDVLRSSNGKSFNKIGTIPGNGNSSTILNYNYTDASPYPGTNYYKLKQVDYNGKSEEYGPVTVNAVLDVQKFRVYQVENKIEVQIYSPDATSGILIVTDTAGHKLSRQQVTLVSGHNRFSINLSIPKGVYVAQLQIPTKTLTAKFVK